MEELVLKETYSPPANRSMSKITSLSSICSKPPTDRKSTSLCSMTTGSTCALRLTHRIPFDPPSPPSFIDPQLPTELPGIVFAHLFQRGLKGLLALLELLATAFLSSLCLNFPGVTSKQCEESCCLINLFWMSSDPLWVDHHSTRTVVA